MRIALVTCQHESCVRGMHHAVMALHSARRNLQACNESDLVHVKVGKDSLHCVGTGLIAKLELLT